MNKKKAMFIAVGGITIFCLTIENINLFRVNLNTKNISSVISVMLENEDGNYTLSESNVFPHNGVINYDKTYCKNGSTIEYDEEKNKVNITSIGEEKCYIYFDLEKFSDVIIDNEGGYDKIILKNEPDYGIISTENEGLYSYLDGYGTSYYFRGAVDNNWVVFGKEEEKDIYWRIIRINGDESIRLIYSGTTSPTEEEKVNSTIINYNLPTQFSYNPSTSTEYVGYMYKLGEMHGVNSNSYSKNLIDEWYKDNLVKYGMYIEDTIYCVNRIAYYDKNGAEIVENYTNDDVYYQSYINMSNNKPNLICDEKLDRFTVSEEKGNGALLYPIGMLTADEAMLAGFNTSTSNLDNYLVSKNITHLASPRTFASDATIFRIYNGAIGSHLASHGHYIRPVISIKSTVGITGSGEWNDPYVIITE